MKRTLSAIALAAICAAFQWGGPVSQADAATIGKTATDNRQITVAGSSSVVKVHKRKRRYYRRHHRRYYRRKWRRHRPRFRFYIGPGYYSHYPYYRRDYYYPRSSYPRRTYRSYNNRCSNWRRQCGKNWGWNNPDFYGCLRYHRCLK